MIAGLALTMVLHAGALPARPPAARAVPVNPLYAFVAREDYPAVALRADEQGRTEFRLDVDDRGFVRGCTIVASSGSGPLDNATCRIMRSRVRFVPARDRRGHFVSDTYANSITWALGGEVDYRNPYSRVQPLRFGDARPVVLPAEPRSLLAMPPQPPDRPPVRAAPLHAYSFYFRRGDYPPTARREGVQGQTHFQMTIAPTGRVTDCIVLRTSGSAALDNTTCRILISRARYTAARDVAGQPTADTDRGSFVWLLRR